MQSKHTESSTEPNADSSLSSLSFRLSSSGSGRSSRSLPISREFEDEASRVGEWMFGIGMPILFLIAEVVVYVEGDQALRMNMSGRIQVS